MVLMDKGMIANIKTPIGWLGVEFNHHYLLRITFGLHPKTENNTKCFAISPNQSGDEVVHKLSVQLYKYFNKTLHKFTIPYKLSGTEFQQKTYCELLCIPYGTTITYGQLATNIGNKNAARAVGSANHRNPLPILIPCHRVVGRSSLCGYAGGTNHKHYLLALEKNGAFSYSK